MKWKKGDEDSKQTFNVPQAKTNPNFIMDKLISYGQELRNEVLQRIEKKMQGYEDNVDDDLTQPYRELQQKIQDLRSSDHEILADAYQADLDLIKKHVEEVCEGHRKEKTRQAQQSNATASGVGFTKLSIGHRQNILRKFSKIFHSKPDARKLLIIYSQNEVDRIKASYAYYHAPQSRFPWDVAFRVLCLIKCGRDVKPVSQNFYDHMVVKLPKHQKHSL